MPEISNPFKESPAARVTPAQQAEVRSAEAELAKAQAASAEAKEFKEGVVAQQERLTRAESRAMAAEAKASGPRPMTSTSKPSKQKAEAKSYGEKSAKAEKKAYGEKKTYGEKKAASGAVAMGEKPKARARAAEGKGSSMRQRAASAEQSLSAKNRFADDNFKLRQAQEGAAEANVAATRSSIRRANTDELHWEGRAASAKRLKAGNADAKAQSELAFQEERVATAQADAEKSFQAWKEVSPRARMP